jgi:hypothetical protein
LTCSFKRKSLEEDPVHSGIANFQKVFTRGSTF